MIRLLLGLPLIALGLTVLAILLADLRAERRHD